MLTSGTRYLVDGNFEAYIPNAKLKISIDDSMNYAEHITNLIEFEVNYKFKKNDFRAQI